MGNRQVFCQTPICPATRAAPHLAVKIAPEIGKKCGFILHQRGATGKSTCVNRTSCSPH